jgi:asparagine synthase (glutamine-hydrolysing)
MIKNYYNKILIKDSYGWEKNEKNGLIIWFKGYLIGSSIDSIHKQAEKFIDSKTFNLNTLSKWCKSLNGHFALIINNRDVIFAAVDKVNTVPLFYSSSQKNFFVSNKACLIRENNTNIHNKMDNNASLEIAMSGYTIGGKTLYKKLNQLMSGECLFFQDSLLNKAFYYTYSPWKVKQRSEANLVKDFNNTLNLTFSELVESINGRQIVVPLSAGIDSRLIVSGLKEFGVENVFCFSYGRKDNFESIMASKIAKKLGYKWQHIEITDKGKKNFFKSERYKSYLEEFDNLSSIPALQDIAEICFIRENKIFSDDAIIINGNTGDFISGGHLFKKTLLENNSNEIWKQFIQKHYSLWGNLNSDSNNLLIIEQLEKVAEIRKIKNFLNSIDHPFFFEAMEFLGRQSMYVVNQQEAYDFNNYDWRLPFWSDSFVSFWEGVSYEQKLDQKLYSQVLIQNDWGGVWKDFPINDNKIEPKWIIPLRFLSKACLFPFGKDKWHSFEKNAFQYWMELTRNCVITPYHRVLLDNKGQKNMFSWLAKDYIEQKK